MTKKLTAKELKHKLKKAVEDNIILMEDCSIVDFYSDLVDKFLVEVLDHPEAWVSDKSSISHFDIEFNEVIVRTKQTFGVGITPVVDKDFDELFTYLSEKLGEYDEIK